MYCSNCGKKVSENDNFCRHCSYLFGKDSGTSTVVQTGNHNTVIGAGEHSKTEVVYGDKVISGLNPQVIKLTACTDIETPVNSFWSILLSAIGLAASLITVLSSFFEGTKEILNNEHSVLSRSWLVLVFVLLLSFCIYLKRQKFIWLYFFNLVVGSQGRIHLKGPLRGDCPDCDGTLQLRYVGLEGTKKLKAVCSSRPSRHIWEWDYE